MPADPPLLRTYVDEIGDRGTSGKSSRFFAMVAITVDEATDKLLRAAIQEIKQALGIPFNKRLHWVDHAKTFDRKQFITSKLAAVPGIVMNVVVFEKASIPAQAGLHDHALFYNYAAGLLMERILLTAKTWPGGARKVKVTFGHVRGFDHSDTLAYFGIKRAKAPSWMPWSLLTGDPKFTDMTAYDGLQAADQFAGMIYRAIVVDQFDGYEPAHFLRVCHMVRRGPGGRCWTYGWKVMALPTTMQDFPWWLDADLG